jgi:glycosyltransferase involved in cell wall biosynthesis
MGQKRRTDQKLPISGCVITYNEEHKIRHCLESLSFCDDIVVVDSFSTDRTIEICREYTARIHRNKFEGYIAQKNFALGKTKHQWVLSLDADERLSPQLREEIVRESGKGFGACSGYVMKRHAYYLGKWINHCGWYPDHKLRLFNKKDGRFGGLEPHDTFITKGRVRKLNGEIYHFPWASLSEQLRTIDRYSSVKAANISACSTATAVALLIFTPLVKFLETYVIKRGFLDGLRGLLICLLSSFSKFLTYAKVIELKLSGSRRQS